MWKTADPATISESRASVPLINKQIAFVNGLYRTYFHRAPQPNELNYALAQLDSGLSQAALKREFINATTKSPRSVSAIAFVDGLYATLGGRPPTPTGQAYWVSLLNSGMSRNAVSNAFQASNGMLPAPTITWPTPAGSGSCGWTPTSPSTSPTAPGCATCWGGWGTRTPAT